MQVRWRPFQLRPDTPPGGVPLSALLPPEYLERAEAHLREATQAAGLPLNRPALVPNTHLAHEAGAFAAAHGLDDAFHRAALRAYFGEARDVGEIAVLVDVGASVGLDRQALRAALESGQYRQAVDQAIGEAHDHGISGVPAFVFGPGAVLTGAQPYDVFQRVMAHLGVAPSRAG